MVEDTQFEFKKDISIYSMSEDELLEEAKQQFLPGDKIINAWNIGTDRFRIDTIPENVVFTFRDFYLNGGKILRALDSNGAGILLLMNTWAKKI